MNAVAATTSQVVLNLLDHAHLGHARDVLHDEGLRLQLTDQPYELPVEAVLRVVDQASVVPDLREALAWRATDDHVDASADIEEMAVDVAAAEVAP
ncbi:MAG TPA: hypothetical protein VK988_18525 [Acidimicrobiales bacterium]|nr:hypothetical protein [Acidimicrobiales bacterium]